MAHYLLQRISQGVVVLIGITAIAFGLEHMLPGSIARAILGSHATTVSIAAFNKQNGLDRAWPIQYLSFLGRLMRGDLGYSFKMNESVDFIVVHALPNDIILVGSSLMLSLAIAIPVGVMQAARRNKMPDYIATGISFFLYSIPAYLVGLLLIDAFAININLLPAQAPQEPTITGVLSHPAGLVLPIVTLTLVSWALFSRYMRSSAIEVLVEDYIRTAHAKGLSLSATLWRHVVRNSLIPVVTLVGLSIPAILTAGLVVEVVFNFPGIGLDYFNAAVNGDYPVELGVTVLVGVAVVGGNLLADLAYLVLDPRVRYD